MEGLIFGLLRYFKNINNSHTDFLVRDFVVFM